MEEDKGIHIVCVGHAGIGRTPLTDALKQLQETEIINKNEDEPDEFEEAGIYLTEPTKQKLREMGITVEKLKPLIEYKDPMEELAKKMNEVIKSMELKPYEHHTPLTNSKPWKKKYFWE